MRQCRHYLFQNILIVVQKIMTDVTRHLKTSHVSWTGEGVYPVMKLLAPHVATHPIMMSWLFRKTTEQVRVELYTQEV